jgi:hypothetical protein
MNNKKINLCDTCIKWLTVCDGVRGRPLQFDDENNVVECDYYRKDEKKCH